MREMCPNCKNPNIECTKDFVGMVSVMMPRNSWVAKWNELTDKIPGVYAIALPSLREEENEERRRQDKYGDEDDQGFVVSDDNENY